MGRINCIFCSGRKADWHDSKKIIIILLYDFMLELIIG